MSLKNILAILFTLSTLVFSQTINRSMNFDINDYVSFENGEKDSVSFGTENYTLAADLYFVDNAGVYIWYDYGASPRSSFFRSANNPLMSINYRYRPGIDVTAAYSLLSYNTWYRIVVTRSDSVRLYINGVKLSAVVADASSMTNTATASIGYVTGGTLGFDGYIDNFVFRRALTTADTIALIGDATNYYDYSQLSNVSAWFKFDTTGVDSIYNSVDGKAWDTSTSTGAKPQYTTFTGFEYPVISTATNKIFPERPHRPMRPIRISK